MGAVFIFILLMVESGQVRKSDRNYSFSYPGGMRKAAVVNIQQVS